jgi:hypothetical protein
VISMPAAIGIISATQRRPLCLSATVAALKNVRNFMEVSDFGSPF